jgi:hypothetical protein
MSWGKPTRPAINYGKVNSPSPREGVDGDIQVRQSNLGARLFGKISGKWYHAPLTATDGNPVTRFGTGLSNYLSIDNNSVDIFKNKVKVAEFGEDIKFTGKIMIGNPDGTFNATDNISIGQSNSNLGLQNVSIGFEAGKALEGDGTGLTSLTNVLIGYRAGLTIGAQSSNTCIGEQAGGTDSSLSTMIGGQTSPSGSGTSNEICLGFGTDGQGANYAVIGNANITRVYGAEDSGATFYGDGQSWSDKRMKEDVQNINIGLDFIKKLTPITYTNKQPSDYEQGLKEKLSWYNRKEPRVIESTEKARIRVGFLAQDVMTSLKDLGFNDNNAIVQVDEKTTQYSMDYSSFVVPLTKAIQELSAKVDTMQTEINNLKG